ncbi:MAG: 3'(2'),5'-bisphosphate nucleotidase CysQ, partial [Actinobacteria bacterium]|nr:3'(2'),5'-bisphosphate nucleotidase CysQ [Actinomycetota bacterium]
LVYNERDTWLPDLLVCQPHLADDILQAVRNFTRN